MVRIRGSGRIEGSAVSTHLATGRVVASYVRLRRVAAVRRGHMSAFALSKQREEAQNEAPGAYLGKEVAGRELGRHVDKSRAARSTS